MHSIKYMLLFFLVTALNTHASNFKATWHKMQTHYATLCKQCETNTYAKTKKQLYHPQWQKFSTQIKHLIMGEPNPNYLHFPAITATMVRFGMHIGQSFELCYLTQCINEKTKKIIAKFIEPSTANLMKECTEFNCSANALGQLFYAARVLEHNTTKGIESIVELGGGYGCLAHIFKSIIPNAKIYIIDIPELLALQYLYLTTAMPHEKIYMHTSDKITTLHDDGIHLIPIHNIMHLELHGDLFISNFALSEVTTYVQDMIAHKNFFNAHTCYITGQLDGWHSYAFEHHEALHNAVRTRYTNVLCQPFHLFSPAQKSYEIIAQRECL